jgi:hypothetical protein
MQGKPVFPTKIGPKLGTGSTGAPALLMTGSKFGLRPEREPRFAEN